MWGMLSRLRLRATHVTPEGVTVYETRLPGKKTAVTDGTSIWVDHRLTGVEKRCAIEHELVHILAGHTGHEGPAVERRVRHETARRLLTLRDVIETAKWAPDPAAIAEELAVTPAVLADFADSLTELERRLAENLLRAHWEGH